MTWTEQGMLETLTLKELLDLSFPVLLLIVSAAATVRAGRWMSGFIEKVWRFYAETLVPTSQALQREQNETQRKVAEGLVQVGAAMSSLDHNVSREVSNLRDDIRDGFAAMQGQLVELYRFQAMQAAGMREPAEPVDNRREGSERPTIKKTEADDGTHDTP